MTSKNNLGEEFAVELNALVAVVAELRCKKGNFALPLGFLKQTNGVVRKIEAE